jgi:hypothetical protein
MLKELERPKPAMLCYPASRVFAAAVAPVLLSCPAQAILDFRVAQQTLV